MKFNRRPFIVFLAMGLLLIPSPARAGANPMLLEQPAPVHRFLDAKNFCVQSINVILLAADVASTRRALQVPGTSEMNPLAQSTGALIALKIAGVGAGFGIAYMMHKSGHHKAERIIPLFLGVPSGIAAVHNAGIHH
jgi:hypothetical protein